MKKKEVVFTLQKFFETFNPDAIVLYGSYMYQDMQQEGADFDRKPDFLLFGKPRELLLQLRKHFPIGRLPVFRSPTPLYFNLTYEGLEFRIGIVASSVCTRKILSRNAHVALRMSKPVNILYDPKGIVEPYCARSRRYVAQLARAVNQEGVVGYLAATYWAEIYRLAESAKVHALAKSAYYDLETDTMKTFAEFVSNIPKTKLRLSIWDVVRLNLYTLRDLWKHIRTNEAGGSDTGAYVKRKVKKVLNR